MKLKKVCGIIGIVAVSAYFIVKWLKKDCQAKNDSKSMIDLQDNDISAGMVVKENRTNDLNCSDVKSGLAEKMSERHKGAKIIVEEAVKNIMSDETPEKTKNKEEINQLFDDIDKL